MALDCRRRYQEFATRRRRRIGDLPFYPLYLAAALYGIGLRLSGALGGMFSPPRRLPRPVVSVGNLTVGGSGKTPATVMLATLLSEDGAFPVILSRGYGGRRSGRGTVVVSDGRRIRAADPLTVGDEPAMMARALPSVPVLVGRDRFLAGREALAMFPKAVLLLDDGFQHRRLARDLDVVCIDASNPWGNGALFPAGTLREGKSALRRAGLIILNRSGSIPAEGISRLIDEISRLTGAPVVTADLALTGFRSPGEEASGPRAFAGARAVSFCGIVRHDHFRATLEGNGMTVLAHHPFPDHHRYRREEVGRLVARARSLGADLLVTTAKDAVKIDGRWLGGFPLAQAEVVMRVSDPALVRRLLEEATGGK